jgi:hypothetical protein
MNLTAALIRRLTRAMTRESNTLGALQWDDPQRVSDTLAGIALRLQKRVLYGIVVLRQTRRREFRP